MATEVWARNPTNYIKECVEVGMENIAFDLGAVIKKKMDPVKFCEIYYGAGVPFRLLVVAPQGTREYKFGDKEATPRAVYPTWSYAHDEFPTLEDLMEKNIADDESVTGNSDIPKLERPVKGQEHRVVVTDMPDTRVGVGRAFLRHLKELQEDYPDCILHVHGLYGFRHAFGLGFSSADIEFRSEAANGKLQLPTGDKIHHKQAIRKAKLIHMLGMAPADMTVPRNRCMYNIKAGMWAGEHYGELFAPIVRRGATTPPVDHESSDADFKPLVKKTGPLPAGVVTRPGDKQLCDTCSLQTDCSYYRNGAVCSLPLSETKSLATYFKTRDSGVIIDGLGTLLAAQTARAERALEMEEALGELDPDVSKMLTSVFDQGVKLAKLVDPALRGGSKVQVNVGAGGAAAVSMASPQQMVSQIVRTLEAQGIPRDKITPDMVQNLLASMAGDLNPQPAIEGTVESSRDERVI